MYNFSCTSPEFKEILDATNESIYCSLDKFNLDNKVEFMPFTPQMLQQTPLLIGMNMAIPPPNMATPPPNIGIEPNFGRAPHMLNNAPMMPFMRPPPPPISHVQPQLVSPKTANNREKNKSMIQQTMENLRNIGKVLKF